MEFSIITLFPHMVISALSEGVVGQSFQHGLLKLQVVNPRDFTQDRHQTVDDRPFGGGDGMVMMIDPLVRALSSLPVNLTRRVVYLSPQGKLWSDTLARQWAEEARPLALICGRYAGVDQRFIHHYVEEEISLGDYILSGGELAALVVVDSVARFVPGVLGHAESAQNESLTQGYFEAPLFTRPSSHSLGEVPSFLLSGDHQRIAHMREAIGWVRTWCRRPDLVAKLNPGFLRKMAETVLTLTDKELKVLNLKRDHLISLMSRDSDLFISLKVRPNEQ